MQLIIIRICAAIIVSAIIALIIMARKGVLGNYTLNNGLILTEILLLIVISILVMGICFISLGNAQMAEQVSEYTRPGAMPSIESNMLLDAPASSH